MKYDDLVRLIEAALQDKQDYCVYMLINDTKQEVYFGVAIHPDSRYQDHANGNVDATKHWSASSDRIRTKTISCGHTQEEASAKAHALEKLKAINGYTVIQTAGI